MYKWLKTHLNWTLGIGALIIESPVLISFLWFVDPEASASMGWLLGLLLPVVIVELALEGWYLYQKKRNYIYLLLTFLKPFYIPMGFIILLLLSNKRNLAEAEALSSRG